MECGKPRAVFSQLALKAADLVGLDRLKETVQYTCGSPITSPEFSLHEKVYVNLTLRYQEHVEFAYYACARKLAEVCCFCCDAEAMRDPELLQKWKVVLPVCDTCRPFKQPPTRQPKKK